MFDVILVSHGPYAEAILEAAELICGKQERVKTFGLCAGESVERFGNVVRQGIEESLSRGDVLVLTDIQMGSPFNVTCAALESLGFRHLTGMNLPLVIEVLTDRVDLPLEQAVRNGLELGRHGLVDVNAFLEEACVDGGDEE